MFIFKCKSKAHWYMVATRVLVKPLSHPCCIFMQPINTIFIIFSYIKKVDVCMSWFFIHPSYWVETLYNTFSLRHSLNYRWNFHVSMYWTRLKRSYISLPHSLVLFIVLYFCSVVQYGNVLIYSPLLFVFSYIVFFCLQGEGHECKTHCPDGREEDTINYCKSMFSQDHYL